MLRFLLSASLLLTVVTVHGQPTSPPPSPSTSSNTGESTATSCPSVSGACAVNGSSNYHSIALTYTNSTGKFSGSILTNLCMNKAYGKINGTYSLTSSELHSASCINQTIPAPAYSSTPVAASLRGRIGLTISGGVNIYGPMDNGFSEGQVCTNGSCPTGSDLKICERKMLHECSSITWSMLPDDCGGHANPYHLHGKLACDYNTSDMSTHSPLVGVALDGRGIYGKYEGTSGTPTDLDACNGHYGDVPSYNDSNGNYYSGASGVYHYHLTEYAPFTVGCFGPVSSLTACKALYSTCDTGYYCLDTTLGRIYYDADCPCFQQNGSTYNQDYNSTCNSTTSPTSAPTVAPTVAPTTSPASTGTTSTPTVAPTTSSNSSTTTSSPTTASPTKKAALHNHPSSSFIAKIAVLMSFVTVFLAKVN